MLGNKPIGFQGWDRRDQIEILDSRGKWRCIILLKLLCGILGTRLRNRVALGVHLIDAEIRTCTIMAACIHASILPREDNITTSLES